MQPYQEYDKRLRAAEQVAPLTSDVFGEQVNLYDRSASFEHVDISLPGNSALPVELRRKLDVRPLPQLLNARPELFGGVGNWEIGVPYITGTFDSAYGWNSTAAGATARCSTNFYPHTNPPHRIEDIWSGYSVVIPGAGGRDLMGHPDASHRPPDGATRLWTTREFDTFSCVPMAYGYPGEGFLMTTAQGVTYRFDVGTIRSGGMMGSDHPEIGTGRPRQQVFLLASRVEDRFGNWVKYTYNDKGHPTRIQANDGRQIDLTYSSGRLATATAHGRQWTYGYQNGQLSQVTQPDSRQWSFSYSDDMTLVYPIWGESPGPSCAVRAPLVEADFTLTITHPAGASGSFLFKHQRHGRSGVPLNQCVRESNPWDPTSPYIYTLATPNYFDKYSLVSKVISGPAISSPMTWSYAGSTGNIPLWNGTVPPCGSCPQTRTTVVTQPDGTELRESYGIVFGLNEGKLLGRQIRSSGGQVLRDESHVYMTAAQAAAQPFPDRYGSLYGGNDSSRTHIRPLRQRTIVQQGTEFSWQGNTFDVFARPLSVAKSSTLPGSPSRTEVTAYHDNLSSWVLGQPSRLTVNGTIASETSYSASALPTVFKQFGKTVQTLAYNSDGTVASVRDGNNNLTTLSSWKRGIPRTIKYPATPEASSGATQSAVVNDSGWITRVTDENGFQHNYQYDPMGRLSQTSYPTGDSVAWNATTFTLTKAAGSAYGIPAGHWQHTVATGNGRKVTYLDALWRPVLVREYDTGNASATQRFTKQAFDHAGRVIFTSYPSSSGTPATGTWTDYDALGRPISVGQDSELGVLVTLSQYLSGFQTRVTSPKGHQTTTGYLAWDEPTTDYPVTIAHPAGVFTDIARDAFGKPTALTRRNSSGSVSLTRRYVYDAHQQLCKSVEPETGATIMAYDGAGNLAWSKAGATQTGTTSCNTSNIPVAQRTVRSYDARNRIQSLVFPDNLGNTTYDYYPDGQLAQITTDNGGVDIVGTAYTYNRRRQLIGEALVVGSHALGIGYGYNANGHLQTHALPGGLTVNYAPNALGQATQAGSYAADARYFPNGALRQFTYGNGIVHTLTQNLRGLPDRRRDAYGSTAFHDDGLDYDGHGNVAAISDGVSGHRGDRTMSYDALDRLEQTVSPMFGTATYAYNVLDNLIQVRLTAGAGQRDHTYVYDDGNRLNLITKTAGGATVAALGYDAQGNLSSRNGQAYQFDYGNRLRNVQGVESYLYDGHGRRVKAARQGSGAIYSMYGQDGVLRYQRNERTGTTVDYVHLGGALIAGLEGSIAMTAPSLTVPANSQTGAYTVSWTSVQLAAKYQLQERVGAGSWSTIHDGAGTSRAVSGKTAGSWGYRVRACSASVCSSWSPVASVNVELPPNAAPTLTVPAGSTSGDYSVNWTTVAAATKYQLQERPAGGSWGVVHDGAGTSKALSGRGSGTWEYRVRGCNSAGCAGYSTVKTSQVTLPPSTVPTLTVPASNTTGGYTVSWNSVATATKYQLQERQGSGSWSAIHDATGTSRAVSGKTTGSWGYRVRACNVDCGAWSLERTVAVTLLPAGVPTLTAPATSNTGGYAVSWTAVTHATTYQLQERLGSAGWSSIHDASARSKAVSGKENGTWNYRVRACNADGCADWSAQTGVQVTLPPSVAPGLSVPGTGLNGAYTVNWASAATATRYELQERQGSGAWSTIHDATGTSKAVSGKTAGSWSYRVRACNIGGCGSWSSTGTTNVVHPPTAAPTLTLPASNYTGAYSVTWTSVATASRYELQERLGSGSWSTIHNAAQTSRAVSGKSTGSWGYRVRACNDAGCAGWSATKATAVTLPPTSVPTVTAPASNATGGYTVSWSSVAAATKYQLQERLGSGSWSTIHDAAGTSKALSGKATGAWSYRARACNAGGCAGWSAVKSVQVTRAPAAAPAWGAIPVDNTSGSYTLTWGNVSGATRYELGERRGAGSWSVAHDGSARSRAFSGKTTGSYGYRVRACNASGCGPYAATVTVEVVITSPPATAPTLQAPQVVREGEAYTVSWSTVSGTGTYRLEGQLDGGSWYVSQNTGATSRVFPSGSGAGMYRYRVQACNASGCGPYSNVRIVQVTGQPPCSLPPCSVDPLREGATEAEGEGT